MSLFNLNKTYIYFCYINYMIGIGTMAVGIKTPFIKENDDINNIVVDSIINASKDNFTINDGDIIAITESAIARAQNNFVTIDEVSNDIKQKFNNPETIGIVHPILSRNRFSLILKAVARSTDNIILVLKYPFDEVGNQLFDMPFGIVDIYKDTLYERDIYKMDHKPTHTITGVNYIEYYREIIESENCTVEFIFSNDVTRVLYETTNILVSDIHTRETTKKIIKKTNKNATVIGLDEIVNEKSSHGYNTEYGLLGSNVSTDNVLKLFPRDCHFYVNEIQSLFKDKTGKNIEVLIYGDGAFKDPVSKIWELADPVVCPAYSDGLIGSPNEVKLKYLIDNDMLDDLDKDIEENKMGTTPRRFTDLLGSLSDLISGSGDKGTPVVYIKNYFKKYNE